jgi:hypothetical protein
MVNFSVKAQDLILRAAAEGNSVLGGGVISGSYKTTDDLGPFAGVSKILNSLSLNNATTMVSQEDRSKCFLSNMPRQVKRC